MDRIVRVSRSTWTCESDRTHQGQHSASDGYAALYPSYIIAQSQSAVSLQTVADIPRNRWFQVPLSE